MSNSSKHNGQQLQQEAGEIGDGSMELGSRWCPPRPQQPPGGSSGGGSPSFRRDQVMGQQYTPNGNRVERRLSSSSWSCNGTTTNNTRNNTSTNNYASLAPPPSSKYPLRRGSSRGYNNASKRLPQPHHHHQHRRNDHYDPHYNHHRSHCDHHPRYGDDPPPPHYPPPWFHHHHDHHPDHHRHPPPPRLQLTKPPCPPTGRAPPKTEEVAPPPQRKSSKRVDDETMNSFSSSTTTTRSLKEEEKDEQYEGGEGEQQEQLNEFEKSEMTQVIAKNISGSKLHESILQKLQTKGSRGMTSSALSWAFSNELSSEIDHYCLDVYHIPKGCVSVLDVVKELDHVQFEYNYDDDKDDESLRFYIATELVSTATTMKDDAATTTHTNNDATRTTTTAAAAAAEGEEEDEEAKAISTNRPHIKQEVSKKTDAVVHIAVDEQPAITARGKSGRSSKEETSKVRSTQRKPSSSKVDNIQKCATMHSASKDTLRDEAAMRSEVEKLLHCLLEKQEGWPCLQSVLFLLRRNKNNKTQKGWPTTKYEFQSFLLDLWGRRKDSNNEYLPTKLKQWLAKQLEGYPQSHLRDRTKFTATRLIASLQKSKCLFLTTQSTSSNNQDVNRKPTRKMYQWDLDRVVAIADLFVKQEGPQISPEEPNLEEDVRVQVQVERKEAVKKEGEVATVNGYVEVLEHEQEHLDDAKPAIVINDLAPQYLAQDSSGSLEESDSRECVFEKHEDEENDIVKAIETVRMAGDGFAALDFLVMLRDNYNGRIWPASTNDLKMCVQALITAVKNQTQQQQRQQQINLPQSIRLHVGQHLNDFSFKTVVQRILEGFQLHFQDLECLEIKDKEEENDAKSSSSSRHRLLCWKMKRIDAIRDHLLHHPHPLQQQQQQQQSQPVVVEQQEDKLQAGDATKNDAEKPPSECEIIEIDDSDDDEQLEEDHTGTDASHYKATTAPPRQTTTTPHPQVSTSEPREDSNDASSTPTKAAAGESNPNDATATSNASASPKHDEQQAAAASLPPTSPKKEQQQLAEEPSIEVLLGRLKPRQRKKLWIRLKKEGATCLEEIRAEAQSLLACNSKQQSKTKGSNRDKGSLVSFAALDVLYALEKRCKKGGWPKKAKSVTNALDDIFCQERIPTHLADLKRELGGTTIYDNSFQKVVQTILPEIERKGACQCHKGAKEKIQWLQRGVENLLKGYKPILAPEDKSQSQDSSSSGAPQQQHTLGSASSAKREQESKKASSKRQRDRLMASPISSRSELRQNESFYPSPSESFTPPPKRQKTAFKLEHTNSLNSVPTKSLKGSDHGFVKDRNYAIVTAEQAMRDRISNVLMPTPPLVSNDVRVLLELLPNDLAIHLRAVQEQLSEIVLDKGRQPVAWSPGGSRINLPSTSRSITNSDIAFIVNKIGGFGPDNRAGLDEQLHRIAAVRNKQQEIVGLTLQIRRRYVFGGASMIADILYADPTKSVLFLGAQGTGKTMLLREVACCLSGKSKVVIVDTDGEIGGDGDVPHPCLGVARRIMVPSLKEQAGVISQCVSNHTPDCIVVDKFIHPEEVEAAKACKDQSIRLMGSAQGTLRQLLQNPRLRGLIHSRHPIFDVIVELQSPNRWNIIHNTAQALECIRKGHKYSVERRSRDPISGSFQLTQKEGFLAKQVITQTQLVRKENEQNKPLKEAMWKFDAIIGHRRRSGQLQVLIQWTRDDEEGSWEPTWEPLSTISEDQETVCREYAEEHDLLEEWSEYV